MSNNNNNNNNKSSTTAACSTHSYPDHANVVAEVFPAELGPDPHLLADLEHLRLPLQVSESAAGGVSRGREAVEVPVPTKHKVVKQDFAVLAYSLPVTVKRNGGRPPPSLQQVARARSILQLIPLFLSHCDTSSITPGCLPANLSACLSVCLPVCMSVHPAVCMPVGLSICLSVLSLSFVRLSACSVSLRRGQLDGLEGKLRAQAADDDGQVVRRTRRGTQSLDLIPEKLNSQRSGR